MEIIENTKVKEKIYIEKLDNGLTVMVLPRKNVRKKYIICGPNFGSIDNEFVIPGNKESTKIPLTMQISNAVADGFHIARFFEEVKKETEALAAAM